MRVPLSLAVLLLALAAPAAAAPPPFAEAVHAYADPPTWTPPDDPGALPRIEQAAAAARHPFRVLLMPHLPEGATAAQTIARVANGWAAQGMDPATNTIILRAYTPPRIEILAGTGYGLAGPALAPYLDPFRRAVTSSPPDVAGGIGGMISMLDTSLNLQALTEEARGAKMEALALQTIGEQLRDIRQTHTLSTSLQAEADGLGAQLLGGGEGPPLTAADARARLKKIEEGVKDAERAEMLGILGRWAKWFLGFLSLWIFIRGLLKRQARIAAARQELDQMIRDRGLQVAGLWRQVQLFQEVEGYADAQRRWGESKNETGDHLRSIPPRLKRVRALLGVWENHIYEMHRALSRLRFWREEPRRRVAAELDREFYDHQRKLVLNPMTAAQEITNEIKAAEGTWKVLREHLDIAADESAVQKLLAPLPVEPGLSPAWYSDHPLQGPGSLTTLNKLHRTAEENPVSFSGWLGRLQEQDQTVRQRLARLNRLAKLQVPDLAWAAIPLQETEDPRFPLRKAQALESRLHGHLQEAPAEGFEAALVKLEALGEDVQAQILEAQARAAFIRRASAYEGVRARAEANLKAEVEAMEKAQERVAEAAKVHAKPPTMDKARQAAQKASQLLADAMIAHAETRPLAACRLLDLTMSHIGALTREVDEVLRRCAELDRQKGAAAEKLTKLKRKAEKTTARASTLGKFHGEHHSAPLDFSLLYAELESLETAWTAEDRAEARAAEESARASSSYSSSSSAYDGGSYASASYSDTSSYGGDF